MELTYDITLLIEEYRTLVTECDPNKFAATGIASDQLEEALCKSGDWTPTGAQAIIMLAREHGAFMLRNALALSIALEIEDGELGF